MIEAPPPPDLVDALGRPLREEPAKATFSQGTGWPASGDPIADIKAAAAEMRRLALLPLPPRMPPAPLKYMRTPQRVLPELDPRGAFLIKHAADESPPPARARREKRRSLAERKERNRKRKQRRAS